MSSNHRRKIARALATATGMTYQQALAAVITAADNGLLPHTLDKSGIQRAVALLAAASPAGPMEARDLLAEILDLSHGLVVVTGGVGAGKTTFLYDCIAELAARDEVRVATVESPVEHRIAATGSHSAIWQHAYGTGHLTFKAVHRGSLRSDPEVIMYGELGDADEPGLVFDSALTGHLTLAGMQGDSAAQVIEGLLLHTEPFLVASALHAIVVMRKEQGVFTRTVVLIDDATRAHVEALDVPGAVPPDFLDELAALLSACPTQATQVITAEGAERPTFVPAAISSGLSVSTGPVGVSKSVSLHAPVDSTADTTLWTDLGFDPVIAKQIRQIMARRTGVMLIVASTSQKVALQAETVLRAALEEASVSRTTALMSLHKFTHLTHAPIIQERPLFDGDWQPELSFANLLRHEPTVIGLDTLTGSWAREMFDASQTGRLVIAIGSGDTPEAALGSMLGRRVTAHDVADHVAGILVLHESTDLSRAGFITPTRTARRAVREHLPTGARGEAALREALTLATVRSAAPKSISMAERDHIRTGLRRLAAMLSVGMWPNEACASLAATMTGEPREVFHRMSRGELLSQAAAAEKHVFEPWAVDMLATADRTGQLRETLDALVEVF